MRHTVQITKLQMFFVVSIALILFQSECTNPVAKSTRERISINHGWSFTMGDPAAENTETLDYPVNRSRSRGGFGNRGGRDGAAQVELVPGCLEYIVTFG